MPSSQVGMKLAAESSWLFDSVRYRVLIFLEICLNITAKYRIYRNIIVIVCTLQLRLQYSIDRT